LPSTDVRTAELEQLELGEQLTLWTDDAWLDDDGELSARPGWWWAQ
jgi:hypothetical protein